jgi:chlorite dismutase
MRWRNLQEELVLGEGHTKAVVPETLEGWAVIHEVVRLDRASWNGLDPATRGRCLEEAVAYLEQAANPPQGGSALFSLLGHKGDLLLLHFRQDLSAAHAAELGFRSLGLSEHLERTASYVSHVELGLYEMTTLLYERLQGEGLEPDSDAWKARMAQELEHQRERMKSRLFTSIPQSQYLCFYPMNKHRGEHKNWYSEPMERRQAMMRAHGMVGRKYGGRVTQVITGSIGFDDWEWGVYLFADDPIVYKKLVYEMRFDEASVWYGEFGPFYVGIRVAPGALGDLFAGKLPSPA